MDNTTAPPEMDAKHGFPTIPGTSRPAHISWTTLAPTQPRQRVRITAYGGLIKQYHVGREGTVVRINKNGNPVIALDGMQRDNGTWVIGGTQVSTCEITDRFGCAKLIDPDGKVIQVQVATF